VTAIYLAGKIHKNDWRHEIVRGLESWGHEADRFEPRWPRLANAVLNQLDYVGPYFMGDDHGCGHGPHTHGCGPEEGMCGGAYLTPGRRGIRDLCFDAIARSDLLFAWLDRMDAYGTLVEIGYAKALGKRIWIASPTPPVKQSVDLGHSLTFIEHQGLTDLWFAFECADMIYTEDSAIAALKRLADAFKPVKAEFDSPLEAAFWVQLSASPDKRLAGLVAQHPVFGGKYRLDFALPDKKIGIELDGYTYHSSKEAFTKDRERQRELEVAGWRIIRFSGAEVINDVAKCVRQTAELVRAFGGGN
jgi:very-short-patch-repair endonuclease